MTSSRLSDLWSLENGEKAELGYGFSTQTGLIIPYRDVFMAAGGSQRIGMGLHYSRWSSDLQMELRAEHHSGSSQPERRIGLELNTDL